MQAPAIAEAFEGGPSEEEFVVEEAAPAEEAARERLVAHEDLVPPTPQPGECLDLSVSCGLRKAWSCYKQTCKVCLLSSHQHFLESKEELRWQSTLLQFATTYTLCCFVQMSIVYQISGFWKNAEPCAWQAVFRIFVQSQHRTCSNASLQQLCA